MTETNIDPKKLNAFGRSFFLLFNRSSMYESNHPYCQQAVDGFLPIVENIVKTLSPLVFIMNQDKFFVDEEPLDPKINTNKLLNHFKKTELQSISFYEGLDRDDIKAFVEIFTTPNRFPHARDMKQELEDRGIQTVKINHVFFKKVSSDEEIISRESFGKAAMAGDDEGAPGSKKMFMDMVLESFLMEEFERTLNIKNITEHPDEVSSNMIQTDLKTFQQSDAPDKAPGLVLAHQLHVMEQEVNKHLSAISGIPGRGLGNGPGDGPGEGPGEGGVSESGANGPDAGGSGDGTGEGGAKLSSLADAVFKMKKQLINGIELQKSLGVSYDNESEILDKANEITDNVLLELIRDEYKAGKITTSRLAQILKRLVPEAVELKRLMPKIKKVLMKEGMSLSDYLNLVQALSHELQSEELSNVLQQNAEDVGLDGAELIQELRTNPAQAAELIFLAAEIRKSGADDHALSEILVDYVEKIGTKLTLDIAENEKVTGDRHLRKVMNDVESQILGRLKNMNVKSDVLERLEKNINSRMDQMFEQIKSQWKDVSTQTEQKKGKNQTVLQILEQSVGENEELGDILRSIRRQAAGQDMDENDFKKILDEVHILKSDKQSQKEQRLRLAGIMDYDGLMFFLEKEIARSRRYDLPFATLSFSVVSAKAKNKPPAWEISQQDLVEAVLRRLAQELRGADVAALMEKNKLVAFLPMTPPSEAKLALKRHLKLLNTKPIDIEGVQVTVRVAAADTNFEPKRTPDAKAFYKALSMDLTEMINRIKNLHGLA